MPPNSSRNYNHGQNSLGQSERNFNSMRFTSSVAKSGAVFLKIHVRCLETLICDSPFQKRKKEN